MTDSPLEPEDEGVHEQADRATPAPVSARSTEHPWEEPTILPARSMVMGALPAPARGRHARRRRPVALVGGAAAAAVLLGATAVALVDLSGQNAASGPSRTHNLAQAAPGQGGGIADGGAGSSTDAEGQDEGADAGDDAVAAGFLRTSSTAATLRARAPVVVGDDGRSGASSGSRAATGNGTRSSTGARGSVGSGDADEASGSSGGVSQRPSGRPSSRPHGSRPAAHTPPSSDAVPDPGSETPPRAPAPRPVPAEPPSRPTVPSHDGLPSAPAEPHPSGTHPGAPPTSVPPVQTPPPLTEAPPPVVSSAPSGAGLHRALGHAVEVPGRAVGHTMSPARPEATPTPHVRPSASPTRSSRATPTASTVE